jgi:hypothetical protein
MCYCCGGNAAVCRFYCVECGGNAKECKCEHSGNPMLPTSHPDEVSITLASYDRVVEDNCKLLDRVVELEAEVKQLRREHNALDREYVVTNDRLCEALRQLIKCGACHKVLEEGDVVCDVAGECMKCKQPTCEDCRAYEGDESFYCETCRTLGEFYCERAMRHEGDQDIRRLEEEAEEWKEEKAEMEKELVKLRELNIAHMEAIIDKAKELPQDYSSDEEAGQELAHVKKELAKERAINGELNKKINDMRREVCSSDSD